MTFRKKYQLKHIDDSKYGPGQQGLFAVEKIYKDEQVTNEEMGDNEIWPFYPIEDKRGKYTKSELLKLIKDHPQLEKIIVAATFSVGDDLYSAPLMNLNENFDNIDEVVSRWSDMIFVNHSCDPNLYFIGPKGSCALRDIEVGEEITHDYAYADDSSSIRNGIKCQCGSSKCRKILGTDAYKDPKWQEDYKNRCTPYIEKKIEEFRQKQNT